MGVFPRRDTRCAESGCFPGRDWRCPEDGCSPDLGAVDKSAISSAGNTTRPMPMDIISE